MDFGMIFSPDDIDEIVYHATMAEGHGFDLIGLTDSQSIFRELYTSLGIVARETESVRIGPAVTNLVTRHPAVTASAICTVDEPSNGRAMLEIGSGDSAVYTLGEHPARLAEMEEYIPVLQTLCRGKPTELSEETVRLKWLERMGQSRDVPVFHAAEGPKILRLAGRIADGIFIGTGLFPKLIQDSIDKINEGAEQAGRDPHDIEKWLLAKANIHESGETAIDEIKMALAASANHAFRFTMEGKQVPDEHKEEIKRLQEEYVPHQHEELGETRNRELVEELGLTEYLANRFAVVGTAEDCQDKLESIESVPEVNGVLLTAFTEDKERFISLFGNDVITDW